MKQCTDSDHGFTKDSHLFPIQAAYSYQLLTESYDTKRESYDSNNYALSLSYIFYLYPKIQNIPPSWVRRTSNISIYEQILERIQMWEQSILEKIKNRISSLVPLTTQEGEVETFCKICLDQINLIFINSTSDGGEEQRAHSGKDWGGLSLQ